MTDSTRNAARTRGVSARVRRRRRLATFLAALVLIAAVVIAVSVLALTRGNQEPVGAPSGGATPAQPDASATAPPMTATQELLAASGDPNACAVSFVGDGVTAEPMLQTQGVLYAGLPIPQRDGLVFGGWYATPEDAAAFAIPGRVNGSEPVVCTEQERTLYGSWKTPDENAAENARIPILMYHQFTSKPEGEDNWLRGNYAYIGEFDAHMNHIATTGFYLPTWDELSAFIDGRLWLPTHSVIVTDDDCDITWLEMGVPVVVAKQVLSTAFCITIDGTGPSPSMYVQQRSHTHNMHTAGADGQGRMVNWSAAEIAADMETSAGVLGVKQVMAYPFGHHNETSKEGLRQAGYEMARTIEPGYVTIGTDKLALPTIRINYGMGLNALIGLIG
ncbi:xylanase [Microbacterium sp. zg.B48]|uniref:xylanase n=1 Tax=Microbacterium sp. zg.B48 TaxID=2969408 RepID=UPI00214CCF52|nr:xylanase [Microbacterium sp. zg.B48]MCR2764917.1 xylanase [Microbacterium sp. zg.B48]